MHGASTGSITTTLHTLYISPLLSDGAMPVMVDPDTGRLLVQAGTALPLATDAVHLAVGSPLSTISSSMNSTTISDTISEDQVQLSRELLFVLAYIRRKADLDRSHLWLLRPRSRRSTIRRDDSRIQSLHGAPSRLDAEVCSVTSASKEVGTERAGKGSGRRRPVERLDIAERNAATSARSSRPLCRHSARCPYSSCAGPLPSATPSPPHSPPPLRANFQYAPFSRFPIYLRSSITVARLYPVFCYLALVGVALCWHSDLGPVRSADGVGRDFARTGNMAAAQIPVVIALGVKGNMVGLAMGVGYEKLQILHKLAGRLIFICSTIHVGYFSES